MAQRSFSSVEAPTLHVCFLGDPFSTATFAVVVIVPGTGLAVVLGQSYIASNLSIRLLLLDTGCSVQELSSYMT